MMTVLFAIQFKLKGTLASVDKGLLALIIETFSAAVLESLLLHSLLSRQTRHHKITGSSAMMGTRTYLGTIPANVLKTVEPFKQVNSHANRLA